jgi:hypothetical protein
MRHPDLGGFYLTAAAAISFLSIAVLQEIGRRTADVLARMQP